MGVPHRVHLGQAVGVDKVQEGAEDGAAHVLDRDNALHSLAHLAVEQRMEHRRARHEDDAVRRQLLVVHLAPTWPLVSTLSQPCAPS